MSAYRGPPAYSEGDLLLNSLLLVSDATDSFALLRSMLDTFAGPIPDTMAGSSSDNCTRLAEVATAGLARLDIRRLLRKLEDDRRRSVWLHVLFVLDSRMLYGPSDFWPVMIFRPSRVSLVLSSC